jgi:replicative superfamily II helicase
MTEIGQESGPAIARRLPKTADFGMLANFNTESGIIHMAFKRSTPTAIVPDSPDKLLLELPRRTIPDVLPHQQEVMRNYADLPDNVRDIALQLPTGSGKTLVGLLTGEWLRRKNQERIVYLCPTKQLVNQVVEQAEEKYGLTVLGFTGSARDYDPTNKAEYRNADRIAVTTYSSLFNTNPFFDNADVVIVDDAHAALQSFGRYGSSVTFTRHSTLRCAAF